MLRVLLALTLLWALSWGPAARADTVVLRQAISASGGGDRFPAELSTRQVLLPDEWALSRPGFAGSLWYRTEFTPPTNLPRGDVLALYIEHVCSTLEVYLNGNLLHTSGANPASAGVVPSAFTTPAGTRSIHDCNHPQLLTLPTALLASSGNVLDIKVSGHALATSG